jgi:hypothetical protein
MSTPDLAADQLGGSLKARLAERVVGAQDPNLIQANHEIPPGG